ncbi:cytochrome P450 [Lactarius akahatsu]|uniref:Cytochrome P450 n=1 Tax=Lactarius akahatsu TaxID=416441 RepID=A0AAD4L8S2_9AGAM|nr:cytochrome P450 [Lactarius akahatsu]
MSLFLLHGRKSLFRDGEETRGKRPLSVQSDVFYYSNAAGQPIVVFNTQKVAADLLDRRAGIYSDCPRNIVSVQILSGGLAIVFQNYGPLCPTNIRLALPNDYPQIGRRDPQLNEALIFASGLLDQPATMVKHLHRVAASTIMSFTYDTPPMVSELDPSRLSMTLLRVLREQLFPVHTLWNSFRIPSRCSASRNRTDLEFKCLHVPDLPNGSETQSIGTRKIPLETLFGSVRDKLSEGIDRPSLVGTLMEDAEKYGLSDREYSWVAAMMYAAGAETTSAVLAWWMLAMATYPEVQKYAQPELNAVVGHSRTPTFADFQHLPYICAMVKLAVIVSFKADITPRFPEAIGLLTGEQEFPGALIRVNGVEGKGGEEELIAVIDTDIY